MHLSSASADFVRFYYRARNDIFAFCRAINFVPTWQQVPILEAVQSLAYYGKPTHMACKSGQGPGKTALSTVIGLWRSFRNEGALTVVTAPTMRQCKDVWLAEAGRTIRRAHPDFRRFFDIRATDIEILGIPKWGIKLASSSHADNMAGWHHPNLSFIIDEASGVDRSIVETILGTMGNKDKLVLQIGNPTTRDSAFFDAFNRDRKRWWCHTMSGEGSPMVDQDNVQRIEETYGRDSDVFRVRVLGEFPISDPTSVMSSDDLEACAANDKYAMMKLTRDKQFGLDFARYGNDASVFYRRSGMAIVNQQINYKTEPDILIAQAFEDQKTATWRDDECNFVADAGGVGQGLLHHFHNARKQVHEFHFNGRAIDSQYDNKITEAFFCMARYVKERRCFIPNDPTLISELASRQYNLTIKNKIRVESKESYRKRVQDESPDRADAMVMAFYDLAAAQGRMSR